MNGLDSVLREVSLSQRKAEDIVSSILPGSTESDEPKTFYSSPLDAPAHAKCDSCDKDSGTLNSSDRDYFKVILSKYKSVGQFSINCPHPLLGLC